RPRSHGLLLICSVHMQMCVELTGIYARCVCVAPGLGSGSSHKRWYILQIMDLDELRQAARSRDPAAWEALGRGLSEELHRFFSNCFDKLSTEDLVQVTALIIMRKFDDFEPEGPHSFRNWVLTIAGRQARAWVYE